MQTDSVLRGRGKLDRGGLQHGRSAGVRQPQQIGLFVGAEQASRQQDEAGDDNARQEPGCQLPPGKPCHSCHPPIVAIQRRLRLSHRHWAPKA
jgi:hypothetical protein